MFRHVVLLRWNESATPEARRAVVDALEALPAAIPEIRGYRVGADAGLAPEGNSDLAIVADFDDVAGYLVYRDHPTHQDVIARLIRPIVAARAAVQHELD
ncbi:MAG TPA: Dabb family protein [Acidimicrobiia bacterium]